MTKAKYVREGSVIINDTTEVSIGTRNEKESYGVFKLVKDSNKLVPMKGILLSKENGEIVFHPNLIKELKEKQKKSRGESKVIDKNLTQFY